MKLYEKIIIPIIIALAILQCCDITTTIGYFELGMSLLSLSYFLAGYWLFNFNKIKKIPFLSIFSGIVFGISLFLLLFQIIGKINIPIQLKVFPIPIILFSLILGIYLLLKLKGKSKSVSKPIKFIFIRSLIIAIILSFFAYTPLNFKPFNKIIYGLNNGDTSLQLYLSVYSDIEEYQKAIEKTDYDEAILKAQSINRLAVKWFYEHREVIGYETVFIDFSQYFLYEAYYYKANDQYGSNNFAKALPYYLQADSIANNIVSPPQEKNDECLIFNTGYIPNNLHEQRMNLFSRIGQCYGKMRMMEESGIWYQKAINQCKELYGDSATTQLNFITESLSNMFFENELYSEAKAGYLSVCSFYLKDTINVENRKQLIKSYNNLANTYLYEFSFDTAYSCAQVAIHFNVEKTTQYCWSLQTQAIALSFLGKYEKAKDMAEDSYECYKLKLDDPIAHANSELLLVQINTELAKYDEAQKYLERGIKYFTENNLEINLYAGFIVAQAKIHDIQSEYMLAMEEYSKALKIYKKNQEPEIRLVTILSRMGVIAVELSDFEKAKGYLNSTLLIFENAGIKDSFSIHYFPAVADIAYLEYSLGNLKQANKYYKQILDQRENSNVNPSVIASALNGQGLVETNLKNYRLADSLFSQSLEIYQNVFSQNNPQVALILLNYAELNILKGELELAEKRLNQSLEINSLFFNKNHIVFGDIYAALGTLELKKKNKIQAKEYFEKALNIYRSKFDEKHWKIEATKRKIGK